MAKRYLGITAAEIIEVRFAYSGHVVKVTKKAGDTVKHGEILASLDRRELQAQLDKELADFERIRAEFEIFALDNPNPSTDKIKYAKTQQQAYLNSSVKSVEISKLRLDNADLVSPVHGVVMDDGMLRSGMHVTPSSNQYKILDNGSYYLAFTITRNGIKDLPAGEKAKVKFEGIKDSMTGTILPILPTPNKEGKLTARVAIEHFPELLPGMTGIIEK